MPKTMTPSQKLKIDEQGITKAATWYRKAICIPWECVLAIAPGRGFLKVWYTSGLGRIHRTILGDQKPHQACAVESWKQKLLADIGKTQELAGSYVHYSSVWDRYASIVFLLAGIGFFGYGLFVAITTSWKWVHSGWPEFQHLAKWVAYYGIVSICIPLVGLIIALGVVVSGTIRLTKWQSWKVTAHGFFRQQQYGQWEALSIHDGDQICPNTMRIGGETVPVWTPPIGGLTHNAILPHMLALLAKRHNLSPTPGPREFPLGMAVRFALVWPIVILGLWYAPLLVWNVPDELDLTIGLNICIVLGACGVFSLVLFIAHLIEGPQYRKRFVDFLAEMEQIQQKLPWEP